MMFGQRICAGWSESLLVAHTTLLEISCSSSNKFAKSMSIFQSFKLCVVSYNKIINEPVHEISNNVVCATSKASDQPAHMRSLIRAFASCLSIL